MAGIAGRVADLWVGRYVTLTPAVAEARQRVAALRPVVAVTGGSSGIGAALARRFAEAGHDVALIARNSGALEDTAARIKAASGRNIVTIAGDVTRPAFGDEIDRALGARGYYLDVLVNNAGIGLSGTFAANNPEDVERMLALNIGALTRLTHQALVAMRARRRGGILNVSSLGGYAPGPYQAAYYASKAYVMSLTEAIACETAGEGLRIAVLSPGPVDTGFHAAMHAEGGRYRSLVPPLSPERVARAGYLGFTLGQRVIVPGLFNRVIQLFLKIAPHPISLPIVAWLLQTPQRKK